MASCGRSRKISISQKQGIQAAAIWKSSRSLAESSSDPIGPLARTKFELFIPSMPISSRDCRQI